MVGKAKEPRRERGLEGLLQLGTIVVREAAEAGSESIEAASVVRVSEICRKGKTRVDLGKKSGSKFILEGGS